VNLSIFGYQKITALVIAVAPEAYVAETFCCKHFYVDVKRIIMIDIMTP